ncbi:MAG: 50S ribosomal protein L23 [bacterium]|nr:50S ribosomal protein L23 [bacterium]
MSIFSRSPKKESKAVTEVPAVAVPALAEQPAIKTGQAKQTIAWRILLRPLVSEKAAQAGIHNQYVFVVANTATKIDVRRAILNAYGIKPTRVNIVRVRGKDVRYGRSQGTTKSWKKAIVTLPKDKKIQVYEGV